MASRHPLGWLIDRLLQVGPLRALLFLQARRLIIRTAESRGIAWRARRQTLVAQAQPLLAAVQRPDLEPPAYYRVRFHAYDEGNLCWAAQRRLRQAIFAVVEPSLDGPLRRVLDVGFRSGSAPWPCGTGSISGGTTVRWSRGWTCRPRCWRWRGCATATDASPPGTTLRPKQRDWPRRVLI